MSEIGPKAIVDRRESHWAKEAPAELGCNVVERLITAAERIAKAYEKLILATGGESCLILEEVSNEAIFSGSLAKTIGDHDISLIFIENLLIQNMLPWNSLNT